MQPARQPPPSLSLGSLIWRCYARSMNPLTPFLLTACGFFLSFGFMFLAHRQRRHLWRLLLSAVLALTCLVAPHLYSRRIYPLGRLYSDPKTPPADVLVTLVASGFLLWTAVLLVSRRKLPYE